MPSSDKVQESKTTTTTTITTTKTSLQEEEDEEGEPTLKTYRVVQNKIAPVSLGQTKRLYEQRLLRDQGKSKIMHGKVKENGMLGQIY